MKVANNSSSMVALVTLMLMLMLLSCPVISSSSHAAHPLVRRRASTTLVLIPTPPVSNNNAPSVNTTIRNTTIVMSTFSESDYDTVDDDNTVSTFSESDYDNFDDDDTIADSTAAEVTTTTNPAAETRQSSCVPILDFDTDSDGNPNQAGALASNLWSANGITISSLGGTATAPWPPSPPMLFDAANPTGNDFDLTAPAEGMILILSEDGNARNPDDNARGGTFVFRFATPQHLTAIGLLDVEEAYELRFLDAAGNAVTTITRGPNQLGDGQLKREDIDVDTTVKDVAQVEIQLFGSGAVTYLEFDCLASTEDLDTAVEISKTLDGEHF